MQSVLDKLGRATAAPFAIERARIYVRETEFI
jgi:hypothetical protein